MCMCIVADIYSSSWWSESPQRCQEQSVKIEITEDSRIEMTCSVDYSGNWAPAMTWTLDDDVEVNEESISQNISADSVSFGLNVRATRQLNGRTYSCRTYFNPTGKPQTTDAKNVPEYNSTWTSRVLNVQCEWTICVFEQLDFFQC